MEDINFGTKKVGKFNPKRRDKSQKGDGTSNKHNDLQGDTCWWTPEEDIEFADD